MAQFTNINPTQELEHIQARIAAVTRGIQSNPDNASDYAQALEVQLMLLNQVIHRLNSADPVFGQEVLQHHYYQ